MSQAVAPAAITRQAAVKQATPFTGQSDKSFARRSRLLSAGDYAQVFKSNRRFSDRYWTVLVRSCEGCPSRMGLAIAKKRAKRAVDRNRLKRIARESFRHHREALATCELVVMNRDAATVASPAELRTSIDALFRKIHTVCGRGAK